LYHLLDILPAAQMSSAADSFVPFVGYLHLFPENTIWRKQLLNSTLVLLPALSMESSVTGSEICEPATFDCHL